MALVRQVADAVSIQLLELVVLLLMDVFLWLLFLCLEQKDHSELVRVSLIAKNLMHTETSKIRF